MMKKQILVVLMLITISMFLIISCTKKSADQLTTPPSGGDCDTANMKYQTDVVPILQSFCYGCHGNGNTGGSGGINLDGYTNLHPYATGGTLRGVITHAPGYVPMPYGLPKMDDCSINKILDWINQGAPNN